MTKFLKLLYYQNACFPRKAWCVLTCIVGIQEKDTVYIGADSAGIAGLSLSIRSDEKVFTNGPFIMGFTTSFRMGQLLRYKFNPPKQTSNQDDMKYMVTDFIDSCRQCFAANGFGDRDATQGGTFLVGYKGKLYTVEADYQDRPNCRWI